MGKTYDTTKKETYMQVTNFLKQGRKKSKLNFCILK